MTIVISSWCFDDVYEIPSESKESAESTAAPPPPACKRCEKETPPACGWPRLIAGMLDALLPYRETYNAARSVLEEVREQIRRHPVPD